MRLLCTLHFALCTSLLLTACSEPLAYELENLQYEPQIQNDTPPPHPNLHLLEEAPPGVIKLGNPEAPITLTLFTEHHCDYCRDFHREHLSRLTKDFITKGDLLVRIIPFPLEKYEHSLRASVATYCARTQKRGLEYHDILFERIGTERQDPVLYAEELEFDMDHLEKCMLSDSTKVGVDTQVKYAGELDVTLVPTLFVNDQKIVGLPYYADLRGMIEKMLTE